MKPFKSQIFMLLLGITLSTTACDDEKTSQEVAIIQLPENQIDTGKVQTLTITKVKTPWYAFRYMVVGKMRQTIPEYQAIKGLIQKFYSFTQNNRLFGGIYLWQNEQDARNWFNQTWFDRTEKTYGKRGIVEYYQILSVHSIASAEKNEGKFWAVLSQTKEKFNINSKAKGLLKIISLKNEQENLTDYLTLWQSKASAEQYFANSKAENTYFDTPILLDNFKNAKK